MKQNDEEYMYALNVINELYYDDEISAKEHVNRISDLDEECELVNKDYIDNLIKEQ